jgi:hypothetical protein
MKVSISIRCNKNDGLYTATATLKHKMHIKIVSAEKSFPLLVEAFSDALTKSTDLLKTECSIDVFFESHGSSGDIEALRDAINQLKKRDAPHIFKLYHT